MSDEKKRSSDEHDDVFNQVYYLQIIFLRFAGPERMRDV